MFCRENLLIANTFMFPEFKIPVFKDVIILFPEGTEVNKVTSHPYEKCHEKREYSSDTMIIYKKTWTQQQTF